MAASLIAFTLTAVLVQDPPRKEATAEEFFRQVEGVYSKADSLRVTLSCGQAGDARHSLAGRLACTPGNKFTAFLKGSWGKKNGGLELQSDGKELKGSQSLDGAVTAVGSSVSDAFSGNFRLFFVRYGLFDGFACAAENGLREPGSSPLPEGFAFAKESGGAMRVVEYQVGPGETAVRHKVWIDPKTLEIVKRETAGKGRRPGVLTETYSSTDFGKPEPAKK